MQGPEAPTSPASKHMFSQFHLPQTLGLFFHGKHISQICQTPKVQLIQVSCSGIRKYTFPKDPGMS